VKIAIHAAVANAQPSLIFDPSGISTEGVRHVTGRLDPAMNGNFNSREVSAIFRAHSIPRKMLSLNRGTDLPLSRKTF
jgi:hypothetical protein